MTTTITIIVVLMILSGIVGTLRKKKGTASENSSDTSKEHSFLNVVFSKEDALAQFMLLLGYGYLGISLYSINSMLGKIVSPVDLLLGIGLVGVIFGYYKKVFFIQIAGVLTTLSWISWKLFDSMDLLEINPATFIGMFGLLSIVIYLTMYYHSARFKRFGLVFGAIGFGLITSGIFLLSSQAGLEILADEGFHFWVSWPHSVVVVLFLAVITGQLFRFITTKKITLYEMIGMLAVVALSLFLLFTPQLQPFISGTSSYFSAQELTATGLGLALIFNIITFLYLVGIVMVGYVRKSTGLINIGGILLFITIISKYFTWFWTLIDRSLFFMVAGVLLVGLGWIMERGRRKIIKEVTEVTS